MTAVTVGRDSMAMQGWATLFDTAPTLLERGFCDSNAAERRIVDEHHGCIQALVPPAQSLAISSFPRPANTACFSKPYQLCPNFDKLLTAP